MTVDPRGLRISGARFREELNLAHIAFPHPLHFKDCVFDSLADLRGAALKELSFEGCHTQEVELSGAEISGGVSAGGLEADGAVDATGVHVSGQLDLSGAKLRKPDGEALSLDGAEITGNVVAVGLEADGEVCALRAHINGLLALDEAKLRNANGNALRLHGAEITGGVFAEGLEADGAVRAIGVHIGGQLGLQGAKLRQAEGYALDLDSAEITGGVFAEGLEADGAVNALGANIGGQLALRGAKLRKPDGQALSLDGAEITGNVVAAGLEADGEVCASAVQIRGQLDLSRARLRASSLPYRGALTLEGAEITGGVFAQGLEADGAVRAPRADIRGPIFLSGAKLRNADGEVLTLDGAEITGGVFAGGLEADGEVRATEARFGGQLDLSGAKLRNPYGDRLFLDSALNLESASIKRLILGPADIADPRGPVDITGKVRLSRAAISDLVTDANPPSPLVATGWEVTDIHGPLRSDWAAARRWLETTTETSVQPWHALAAVYERNGEPADARRLRFAAANKVTSQSPLPTVTAGLLNKIGTRELQLNHEAFDAMPPSRSLEHLREMLVHHRMMPDRGDPRMARFESWLEQRLETLHRTDDVEGGHGPGWGRRNQVQVDLAGGWHNSDVRILCRFPHWGAINVAGCTSKHSHFFPPSSSVNRVDPAVAEHSPSSCKTRRGG